MFEQGVPFNMSLATLARMNQLLDDASLAAMKKDRLGWFSNLMTLRRDLFPFLKPEEESEVERMFNELPKTWSGNEGHNVDKVLDRIDIKMRKLMYKKGILMKKGEDITRIFSQE